MANRRKIIGKLWKFGTRIANRHKRRSTRETLKTKGKKTRNKIQDKELGNISRDLEKRTEMEVKLLEIGEK